MCRKGLSFTVTVISRRTIFLLRARWGKLCICSRLQCQDPNRLYTYSRRCVTLWAIQPAFSAFHAWHLCLWTFTSIADPQHACEISYYGRQHKYIASLWAGWPECQSHGTSHRCRATCCYAHPFNMELWRPFAGANFCTKKQAVQQVIGS